MDHDTWLNQGNPMDKPEKPLDIEFLKQTLLDIAEEVELYPNNWTKGAFARDGNHNHVSSTSDKAECWSAAGFVNREFYGKGLFHEDELIEAARKALTKACGRDFELYNCSLKKPEEFVKWVREAAELCT